MTTISLNVQDDLVEKIKNLTFLQFDFIVRQGVTEPDPKKTRLSGQVARPIVLTFQGQQWTGEVSESCLFTNTPVNEHSDYMDLDDDDRFYATELADVLDDSNFVSLSRIPLSPETPTVE